MSVWRAATASGKVAQLREYALNASLSTYPLHDSEAKMQRMMDPAKSSLARPFNGSLDSQGQWKP